MRARAYKVRRYLEIPAELAEALDREKDASGNPSSTVIVTRLRHSLAVSPDYPPAPAGKPPRRNRQTPAHSGA